MTFDVMKWLEAIRTVEGANPPTYYAGQVRCANGLVFVVRAPRPLPPAGLLDVRIGTNQGQGNTAYDLLSPYLLPVQKPGRKRFLAPPSVVNEVVAACGGYGDMKVRLWAQIKSLLKAGVTKSEAMRRTKGSSSDIKHALDPFYWMDQHEDKAEFKARNALGQDYPSAPTAATDGVAFDQMKQAEWDQSNAIRAAHMRGTSIPGIAKMFGVSAEDVRAHIAVYDDGAPRTVGGTAATIGRNREIVEAHASGVAMAALARRFDISARRVAQIVDAASPNRPKKERCTLKEDRNAALIEMYRNGASIASVAKKFGLADKTAAKILQRGY